MFSGNISGAYRLFMDIVQVLAEKNAQATCELIDIHILPVRPGCHKAFSALQGFFKTPI